MQIQTYGHDIEVTPALREYVETKLERLGRHVERPFEVRVQLCMDKPNHKAEANLTLAGKALHAAASAKGCHDFAAHWAGQGAPLARALPAAELVRVLVEELQKHNAG